MGKTDFAEAVRRDPSAGLNVLSTLSTVNSVADSAEKLGTAGKEIIDNRYRDLGFEPQDSTKLAKLNGASGVLGLATGAKDIFAGVSEGGVDGAVKAIGGAGTIAGGVGGASAVASHLPGRAGSAASGLSAATNGAGTAAKFLTKASGVGSVIVGVHGAITGDSTEARVAGVLAAASGTLLVAGGVTSATILGAPAARF